MKKHKLFYIFVIFLMFGCAGVQIDFDENRAAHNMGALIMDVARTYAPDYVPEIEIVRDRSLIILKARTVELGPVIGDILAIVQGLSDNPDVDKYGQIVADASRVLFDAVLLNWQTPEGLGRAKAIIVAFLEGMQT